MEPRELEDRIDRAYGDWLTCVGAAVSLAVDGETESAIAYLLSAAEAAKRHKEACRDRDKAMKGGER